MCEKQNIPYRNYKYHTAIHLVSGQYHKLKTCIIHMSHWTPIVSLEKMGIEFFISHMMPTYHTCSPTYHTGNPVGY